MKVLGVVLGVSFLLPAVIVFLFADGLRRWYSGIFFAIIGTVTLLNALYWGRTAKEWAD